MTTWNSSTIRRSQKYNQRHHVEEMSDKGSGNDTDSDEDLLIPQQSKQNEMRKMITQSWYGIRKILISNFRNFLKSNDKSSQKMLRDLWISLDSQSSEFQGSSCLIQNPKRQQWLWSFNNWCLIEVQSLWKQQEWNEIMLHQTIFRNQKYSLKNSFEIELIFHHCVFVINSSTTESFQNHYKTLSKTIFFFFKNMGKIKYW